MQLPLNGNSAAVNQVSQVLPLPPDDPSDSEYDTVMGKADQTSERAFDAMVDARKAVINNSGQEAVETQEDANRRQEEAIKEATFSKECQLVSKLIAKYASDEEQYEDSNHHKCLTRDIQPAIDKTISKNENKFKVHIRDYRKNQVLIGDNIAWYLRHGNPSNGYKLYKGVVEEEGWGVASVLVNSILFWKKSIFWCPKELSGTPEEAIEQTLSQKAKAEELTSKAVQAKIDML